MKLDALDHPKTFDFAARLGVSLPTALGHLELLWAFAGKQAAQGNIGKWPDGAIARACYWMGEPDTFLQALLESGFIDSDEVHRLTIHDWNEHAPGWVRAKLVKLKLPFFPDVQSLEATEVENDSSSERSSDGSSERSSDASSRARVPKGSEGKGSEGKSTARARKARHTPIPDDFGLTPERQAYAEKHLPGVDPANLMETFRGKAKAAGWKYVDWDQAWQTLVRGWAPNSGHWSSGQYPRLPQPKQSEKPKEEFRAPGIRYAN